MAVHLCRLLRLLTAVGAAVILSEEATGACTVCFQGIESPLLDSARAGVLTMAVVVVGVLGVFVGWFRRLARREREAGERDEN